MNTNTCRAACLTLLATVLACASAPLVAAERIYRLGAGDRVRLLVFGHPDLSGEYQVDGSGLLSLPLAGTIKVRGRTLAESRTAIVDALAPDYLKNPKVNLQVMNYRPFYIMGEVKNPGSYPYVSEMNVLTAVAVAGGYLSDRARRGKVVISRGGRANRQVDATGQSSVLPGDIVEILDRRF